MTTASDNALADRVLEGDEAALQQLLLLRYDWLLGYVRSQIGRNDRASLNAEDIVQEACCKVFQSFQRFRPASRGALFSWFKTIARNQLIDTMRRKDVSATVSAADAAPETGDTSDEFGGLIEELAIADDPRASVIVRGKELRHAFWAALEELNEDQRRVIELLYIRELSIEEAAAELGKPTGSIRGLRTRARDKLKDAMIRWSFHV